MAGKRLIGLLYLLLITNIIACNKNGNKSNQKSHPHKNKTVSQKEQLNNRQKRAIHPEREKAYIPLNTKLFDFDLENAEGESRHELEQPFWGTRGRRDGSEEISNRIKDDDIHKFVVITKNCKSCFKNLLYDIDAGKEAISPFWGNRGRRNSEEIEDDSGSYSPFWGNRGRRQEEEPFWGTRGRREQELPFWGNRGRHEGIIVRNGKYSTLNRDSNKFDSIRKNRVSKSTRGSLLQAMPDEAEPFWGNRGRRDIVEPFWGSRGRKKDVSSELFEQYEPFWGSRGRRKAALTHNIMNTMNKIKYDIDNLSRMRRTNDLGTQYWSDLPRESEISTKSFLSPDLNEKSKDSKLISSFALQYKPSEPETVLNSRIYAEQPRYILVERSSRSSAEDDPFYITRGKKFIKNHFDEAARGRRGAIEELVKSVRNDPYYIARGKKGLEDVKIGNTSISKQKLEKAVYLICSTIDLLNIKSDDKVKREINDNDRDRRTILKKLAAKLQNDPYFVSRGKRGETSGRSPEDIEAFINQVATMCE